LMPNRRHSDTSELTNGVAQRQVSIAPDIMQDHLQIEHRRTSLQRTAFAWVHRLSYRSPLRKALLGPLNRFSSSWTR
jgi:hypothetical protein